MNRAANDADRVRLDFPGCDIWLHATSEMERTWRAGSCAKEPWTVRWIETAIATGDVLYDIGANVGTFSLIAAKHRGALVFAFEPGYASFARLCENIQLNGCHYTIVPMPFPLAEASALLEFKYRTVDPGQSRHRLKDSPWKPRSSEPGAQYVQPVCAMRLDEAIERFRLPPPAHLKIDVDGAEARVLAGATATLRLPKLRSVLIEVDAAQWDSVARVLHDAGFVESERQTREGAEPGAPWYGVFTRSGPPKRRMPWSR